MLNGGLSIAHITEAFDGGLATYMALVLPALTARGHDVTLFCCEGRKSPGFVGAVISMSQAGVKVKLLPMRREIRPWHDICSLIRLYRKLKIGRYDLVHTHCSKAGALGRLAARAIGCPAVHTPHCYAFLRARTPLGGLLIRGLERVLRSSTSGLIAVCDSEKAQAIKYGLIDQRRCVVVQNGLPAVEEEPLPDRRQLRQKMGLPESAFVITMAARLVGYKGINLFLRAAELCRRPNTVFVLAGQGEMEHQVREHVARLGMADRVYMLGHVPDVPMLLSLSDLCVSCSQAEGQPYTLLEAMRGGCPIVATAAPGIQDLLEHGKTGIFVQPDAKELTRAICELADNYVLRSRLAAQAREKFLEAHLLDKQVDALIAVYKCILSGSPVKAASCPRLTA